MTLSTNSPLGTIDNSSLVWLLGQPSLSDYLEFVEHKVIDGAVINARTLVEEWRTANDVYYELEKSEAGIADTAECLPIEEVLESLAAEVRDNVWYRSSFDNLPAHIAKVELDKLIVSQVHVELGYTHALGERLLNNPDPTELFRFCLPLERSLPPVRVQRTGKNRWLLSSPSTDFRSHSARFFTADDVAQFNSSGPTAGMVGMMFGFGSNFMTAIRSKSRLLLQNGYHRAYTLRSLGFTHAYCIVEDVTRKDELRLTATSDVADDPEFYFAAARPPLLRDFFDPRLRKVLETLPMECQVEIELKVKSTTAVERKPDR